MAANTNHSNLRAKLTLLQQKADAASAAEAAARTAGTVAEQQAEQARQQAEQARTAGTVAEQQVEQARQQAEQARTAEAAARTAGTVAEQQAEQAREEAEKARAEARRIQVLLAEDIDTRLGGSGSESGGSGSDPEFSSPGESNAIATAHIAAATPATGCDSASMSRPLPRQFDTSEELFAGLVDDVALESTLAGPKNCFHCGKPSPSSHCGRCKVAFYCNTDCQRSHWLLHRAVCAVMKERRDAICSGDPVTASSAQACYKT